MSSSRPFMHPDFDRAVLELPLRPKQRALLVALGDLGSGNGAPSVDADALMTEMARRSGAPVTSGNFRQQLSRLNRALGDAEAPFSLGSRAGRITVEPSVHWNRASQLDSVRQALVEHSGEKMRADIDSFVAPRAAATHLLVMWSYAWLQGEQQAIQIELFEALKAKLAAPPARYQHLPRIEMWRDEERINLAEEGTAQMDDACARAFLGLLVYSDRYPHSTPCKRETDYFLDEEGGNLPEKRSIVLRFNCAAGDMQPRFLRRIVYPGGAEDAFLDQWVKGDAADRNKLVNDLALQIFENATEFCGREPNPSPPSEPGGRLKKGRVESFMARQPERMRHDDTHSTPPLARAGAHGYDAANPAGTEDPAGIDIVERIIEWSASSDPLRARVTALLGDFGMGKTVTCQLVCRRMIERTDEGQALPTPVYFDLRDIPRPEHPEQVTLESLIDDLLRQSGESTLRASEVIDFIRSRDALVIFDGLDEITNKYSMDVARIIYRQLIGIVPASIWREDARRRIDNRNGAAPAATRRHGPSILMSCRSQYFADFAAERGFLSDADRFGLKLQEDIAVYVMLPFSPKQIRDYIRRNLPSEDHDRALSLIESTYDLSELARRPILLRYMSELIHRLEAEKLAGREISLSGLYDILVRQAFERDSPKHVIPIPDKKRLLQALALHLHGREREDISNERLIQWLDLEIGANFPKLAGALRGAEGLRLSEIFVQDLRNATLLSRPAESGFRFGHTSLREYFLAGALYEAVLEGNGESGWAVKVPSKETIDFLLQHHSAQEAPEKEAFAAQFRSLLEPERPLAVRKLAFAVWRQSFATASPLPRPREIDCSGFQLQGEELIGSRSKLLPLAGSLWHGADLRQALVQDVDLTGADFTEVRAVSAKFVRCALRDARFHDADLAGSLWRDVHLNSSALEGA
ncbi:MAG TPA: NACHT domain-containing protein, partial [Allosphingosinicella sp.]|nr:NACHT domain-containing protein [Allosphingosinicella sp.]